MIYWSANRDAKLEMVKEMVPPKFATRLLTRFGYLSMFVSLSTVMQTVRVFAIRIIIQSLET